MKQKNLFLAFGFLLSHFSTFSQDKTFLNWDCYVSVTAGGLLHVNGDIWNDGTFAVIQNDGTIITENNGTRRASVYWENASNVFGNGLYKIEQDWVNSASFAADQSTVELYSSNSQQFITSKNNQVTTFHNLTLTGTGTGNNRKKTLSVTTNEPASTAVNAYIDATGVLTLNDRELDTDTNTMFVLNPSLTAVSNNTVTFGNEGFVSSLAEGSLSRVTNVAGAYVFPTGSSAGTLRYRPVILTPNAAAANTYSARLVNFPTPDVANIDSIVTCKVNPDFFHKLKQTAGTTPASIDIFYHQPTDGPWDAQAQWEVPVTNLWNHMGTATHTNGTPYNDVLVANWSNFANDSFVLVRNVPPSPVITCVDSICPWTKNNIFSAAGDGPTFVWSSPVGTNITSGQGSNTVSIDWHDTTGVVKVYQIVANGCISFADSCIVNLAPYPIAGFDTLSKGMFNNDYKFTDTSSGGPTTWIWHFGDGDSSYVQHPQHHYIAAGTYTVMQIVNNRFGCVDTIFHVVEVKEGIIIPNVFTPNSDGINDQFYIPNSGVKEFYIEIYDRWGLKMFETTSSEIRWDGRTMAGKQAPDGTYYFVLKAIMYSDTVHDYHGFLQLISQGPN